MTRSLGLLAILDVELYKTGFTEMMNNNNWMLQLYTPILCMLKAIFVTRFLLCLSFEMCFVCIW